MATVARRLHDITNEFLALEDMLLETGGEVTPEVEALMASLHLDLDTKVDGYSALISELVADGEKWKAEEARCSAHRATRENAAKRLKQRLVEEMVRMDRLKVETPRFKVGVQYASQRSLTVLVPLDQLPTLYQRVTVSADAAAIKAAMQDGDVLMDPSSDEPIAKLEPATAFVRIR